MTAYGVVLLALAGCGSGGRGEGAHRSAATARSSASATAASQAAAAGPARPVDAAARIGPKDGALADLIHTTTLPGGSPKPPQDAVVVVRRGSENIRDFGWISGDAFCLGHTYRTAHTINCGPYKGGTATAFTPGVDNSIVKTLHRMQGFTDALPASADDSLDKRYYTLTAVLDDPGPFRLSGDDHRGVLHQARAALAPNRTVTFLEWGYSGPSIPLSAKVCSAASGRCVQEWP